MRRLKPLCLAILLVCSGCVIVSGCASGSSAAQGAKQGAAMGAISGAVGSMVGALVFGGNVLDAGARGAVVGGSVGATAGAMAGASRDKAAKARQSATRDAEIESLRQELGPDAFNGAVALAECKHSVALANAAEARKTAEQDYRLAGLWVEILTLADQQRESEARALFPSLIEQDPDIRTAAQAEQGMRTASARLGEIRRDYGRPMVCGT